RVTEVLTAEQRTRAITQPPATTRAAIRGEFLSVARAFGVDYSVDWVHHKLVDRPLEAVMLKDPLAVQDERIDTLVNRLGDRSALLTELSAEQRLQQSQRTSVPLALTERYAAESPLAPPEPPMI
ncbi:MAG TPA: proteasome accessory factor PafA2 family protein, partial [Candidatus Nesterenkonia stercoripullorum]|nr:proteasome accessory factor PafA2 family protein [Candidatus Nesterenkonia stercoripullorum]